MRSAPSTNQLLTFLCATAGVLGCTGSDGDAGGLSAPSNLTAVPMGGGVHLTWKDNATNEDGFDIERTDGNSTFGSLDSVPFDSNLYHDSAVTFGITYTYRVRAKRAAAYSAYSNEASADPGGSTGGSTGSGGVGGPATGGGGAGGTATGGGGAGGSARGGTTGGGGAGGSARGGTTGGGGAGGSARGGTTGGGQGGRGGTGAAGGASGTAGPDAGAPVVSFRSDVVPSLVRTCGSTTTGCHNADQAVGRIMPQFGPCKVIWFAAVDGPVGATYTSGPNAGKPTGCPDLGLYDRLLQLHSMLCDGATWSDRARYVVPFDPQASLLYQVIAGDPSLGGKCSANGLPVTRMPKVDPTVLPNGVPLPANEILKIRDWIMQGAPNN